MGAPTYAAADPLAAGHLPAAALLDALLKAGAQGVLVEAPTASACVRTRPSRG